MTEHAWVIKGRPDRNDLPAWLATRTKDVWGTSAPPRDWQAGDRVFFWESSPAMRIVGLGELSRVPAKRSPRGTRVRFHVSYLSGFLSHPIGLEEAKTIRGLAEASFLKSGPARTLFKLSPAQARALYRHVAARNPELESLWPDWDGRVSPADSDLDDSGGTPEGRRRLRIHLARERNRALIERKRRDVLELEGALRCEICHFDFEQTYGTLGARFCEVHHLVPLANLTTERRTRLEDLAILCSNCHRMVHRDGKCRSLKSIRATLRTAPSVRTTRSK